MKNLYLTDTDDDFDEWYEKYAHFYKINKRISYLENIIGGLNLEKKRKCPICG